MKVQFRPIDVLGIVGVIGTTVGAIVLKDCWLAWISGLSLHAIYTIITSRQPRAAE